MRAIMPIVLPDVLSWRKRRGLDRWDEMWDGELHMAPAPNYDHQNLESDLEAYLRMHWARSRRAKVMHQMNVASSGGWPNDFRIPDLILLTRERIEINRGDYLEGAPDVVVEIESPGDETREKLQFYAELGVPEVWIIDRDSKEPEIHLLRGEKYRRQRSVAGGWVRSPATGIELRSGRSGKLSIRLVGNDETRQEIPED
jgi:Uma2 family endonuclease